MKTARNASYHRDRFEGFEKHCYIESVKVKELRGVQFSDNSSDTQEDSGNKLNFYDGMCK